MIVLLKEFFYIKLILKKIADDKKQEKLPGMQIVNDLAFRTISSKRNLLISIFLTLCMLGIFHNIVSSVDFFI